MGKMWIRQVKAIRNDGNASTIDLQQGLNCIIGPSNTGKTGIAKTISFVCGGNVIPFTDVTGYAGASVTFSTEHGEVTLQRSLASQTIQVSSTDSDVEPGDYTVARRGKNKRPINSVLLTMLDVDEARRIAVNEAYRTVAFTWNAIRHLLLVPEDQIVRPEPSILLPKTTSNTTMTQNLSALLVLAQDETFNDEARQESSAERHARRQAVERFIFSQLDIIEPRIKQLEQLERDAATEGKTVDSYIEKLRNTLQQLEQQRRKTIDEDAELVEHISALHQENERLDVLLAPRETLLGQYDSDLARLDLQLQAMRHNREQPYPDVCQFCHSTVHIDPPSEEDIRARENEMSRIRELRNGVAKDQESLRQARIQVTQSIDEAQNAHQSNMEQLHRNLEPEARTIRQRLDGLAQSERIRAEYAELTALRKRFQATLDGADEEKVDYKKYRPREWFHEDFYYSMGATMRGILKDSGFSGTDNVGFSRETFDIEIGGYSKAEEQGKGYCAFFNTVMMLAFHDYLNRRSVHAPGWLLIDTPLLGFDEGAYTANGSLRSGLFEHLKLQAANQQIIILENTDHIGELDFSGNVNVITFTKDQTDGRYGYLDGVVDVAERPGVGRR